MKEFLENESEKMGSLSSESVLLKCYLTVNGRRLSQIREELRAMQLDADLAEVILGVKEGLLQEHESPSGTGSMGMGQGGANEFRRGVMCRRGAGSERMRWPPFKGQPKTPGRN